MAIQIERIKLPEGETDPFGDDTVWGPVVRCDICRQVLSEDARPGEFLYDLTPVGEGSVILFACSEADGQPRACRDEAEQRICDSHEGATVGWDELPIFLWQLDNNANVAVK